MNETMTALLCALGFTAIAYYLWAVANKVYHFLVEIIKQKARLFKTDKSYYTCNVCKSKHFTTDKDPNTGTFVVPKTIVVEKNHKNNECSFICVVCLSQK